jgi:hypothetical protein
MNGLRTGDRSPTYEALWRALVYAPPGATDRVAGLILTPEQASHPLFSSVVNLFRRTELEILADLRDDRQRSPKKRFHTTEALNLLYNQRSGWNIPLC